MGCEWTGSFGRQSCLANQYWHWGYWDRGAEEFDFTRSVTLYGNYDSLFKGRTSLLTADILRKQGIGQFTIQDATLVTEADLGVNFFLEEDSVGKFKAPETCRLLKELNPDVEGHYITEVSMDMGAFG